MKRSRAPMVRLSDKERLIVTYITKQLEMAYRNTSGKPVYARNMDQVMKDIFGIKKFCKTLERARHNEAIMIELMKALDTETLWKICRSKEHYRLLCTLVATDHQIVKMGKKLNNMADMEPTERPTRKIKKLMKDLKRSKKMYRTCVKTFQDIFDIEKVNKKGDSMMDYLSDWLDRNDNDSDFFYDFDDYGFNDSAIESMDEYIRSKTSSRRKKRPASAYGALDLFGSSDQLDDDLPGFDSDEEDEDEEDDTDERLTEILEYLKRRNGSTQSTSSTSSDDMRQVVELISKGFDKLADGLNNLYDVLVEDEDEPDNVPMDLGNTPSGNGPVNSIQDMIAMSEASKATARPRPGPTIAEGSVGEDPMGDPEN